MLALQFHPGEDEFILEENVPEPIIENDDDVLVEVQYAGLCGTDVHIVQVNNNEKPENPENPENPHVSSFF